MSYYVGDLLTEKVLGLRGEFRVHIDGDGSEVGRDLLAVSLEPATGLERRPQEVDDFQLLVGFRDAKEVKREGVDRCATFRHFSGESGHLERIGTAEALAILHDRLSLESFVRRLIGTHDGEAVERKFGVVLNSCCHFGAAEERVGTLGELGGIHFDILGLHRGFDNFDCGLENVEKNFEMDNHFNFRSGGASTTDDLNIAYKKQTVKYQRTTSGNER